jgi:hypothetical protein
MSTSIPLENGLPVGVDDESIVKTPGNFEVNGIVVAEDEDIDGVTETPKRNTNTSVFRNASATGEIPCFDGDEKVSFRCC